MNEPLFKVILLIPTFLLSLSVHEYAHGWVAYRKGDDTAFRLGRLTLNPLAHADLLGTLILPCLGIYYGFPVFGWAKPVPVDARNLKNPLKDMGLVAVAGPLSNLILAILATFTLALSVRLSPDLPLVEALQIFMVVSIQVNLMLFLFNLLPIPPLDGSRILSAILPKSLALQFLKLERYAGIALLLLLFSGGLRYLSIPLNACFRFFIAIAGIS